MLGIYIFFLIFWEGFWAMSIIVIGFKNFAFDWSLYFVIADRW